MMNVRMEPGIEELREKRDEIQLQIAEEEAEKNKIQQDLQLLTKRLAHVNDSLARKVWLKAQRTPGRACLSHREWRT